MNTFELEPRGIFERKPTHSEIEMILPIVRFLTQKKRAELWNNTYKYFMMRYENTPSGMRDLLEPMLKIEADARQEFHLDLGIDTKPVNVGDLLDLRAANAYFYLSL